MKSIFISNIIENSGEIKQKWDKVYEDGMNHQEWIKSFYKIYGSVKESIAMSFIDSNYTKKLTKVFAVKYIPSENMVDYKFQLINVMYVSDKGINLENYKSDCNIINSYNSDELDKVWEDLEYYMKNDPQFIEF